jgi:hypothetical protein
MKFYTRMPKALVKHYEQELNSAKSALVNSDLLKTWYY